MDDSDVARFWSKVDKDGPVPPHRPDLGPCWLWRGHIDRYGYFWLDGKNVKAHRVAWFLATGEWPKPWALHHCDNPPCVNNEGHIWTGTHADNMRDAASKGRLVVPPKDAAWLASRPRGERHQNSKLTAEKADAIRSLHAAGWSKNGLARRFHVSEKLIYDVVLGRAWSVTEAFGAPGQEVGDVAKPG